MPDHMRLHILPLIFHKRPFFNPSSHLPTLKFNHNIIGIDRLRQVQIDVPGNGVAREVERLVELDES